MAGADSEIVNIKDAIEKKSPRIGVFVCHCGTNIAGVIDPAKVTEYASTLPNVVVAQDNRFMCSSPGQELIKEKIKEYNLDRIIVAACSPRLHEPTFRNVVKDMGLNEYCFEQTNIREHDTWCHIRDPEKAFQVAKDLVRASVGRAALLEPIEYREVPVTQKALVVGGGISGIYAALDIADMGFKTYLVERTPSIGGHMAQLDKTFPTLDCSMCILTPKMVEVARNPNVEILSYSEVEEVHGYVGNFTVTVRKKARYIDAKKCNGCGKCVEICPVYVPNEYNERMDSRRAIYVPLAQAVPNTYTIDMTKCIQCHLCERICELKAIDFSQKDELVNLEVGAIVVATGYDQMRVNEPEYGLEQYKYGLYPNILAGLEMERIISPTGPTQGEIIRPSDGKHPHRVAFIQCVGSRDFREGKHNYCSRVCCMYAVKLARLIKDHHPETEITIYYMDIRAFGKGYEEFYHRAQELGIKFVRGRISEILEDPETHNLILRSEDTFLDRVMELEFDLVVLATGIHPRDDVEKVQKIFNISRSPDGFFLEAHPKLRPVETNTEGVFLGGCCQGPKDIPDSVAQACGAAAKAGDLISKNKLIFPLVIPQVNLDLCRGCGECVNTCPYSALSLNEHSGKVQVESALCKGCGTCCGECPVGAIELRHYKDTYIYHQIESLLEGVPERQKAAWEKGEWDPFIVTFVCNWCTYGAADLAGTSRLQYPPTVRLIRLPCTGKMDITYILHAFELGADGVIISGCILDQCHYASGNYKSVRRVDMAREILKSIGFEPERLSGQHFISAAMADEFVRVVKNFTEKVRELGPSPVYMKREKPIEAE